MTARNSIQRQVDDAELVEWPEPADLLGQNSDASPAFPTTFLPAAIQEFAVDAAERMQVPVDYIAIPLIIGAGAVIGKDFRMAPKANDDWVERPCLWGGIVAPSGSLKSPAFKTALEPITIMQLDFWNDHQNAMAKFEVEIQAARIDRVAWTREAKRCRKSGEEPTPMPVDPAPPAMKRIIVNETTQEALVQVMAENPRGVLLFRDELSGFILSFNQYRQGADRQFYLEAHAGGPYIIDRKMTGSTKIDDLFLSICGGIQPDIIAKVLNGGDLDGMSARFSLLVWPESRTDFRYVDRPADVARRQKITNLFREMSRMEPGDFFSRGTEGRHLFRFDTSGQTIFKGWFVRNQQRLIGGELHGPMAAHVGKYAGLFARLAIVRHLLLVASGGIRCTSRVGVETAKAVASFIDDYLEPHARRIYRQLGSDPAFPGAKRIAQWLIAEPTVTSFTAREVRKKGWQNLTDQGSVDRVLEYMVNVAGWLSPEGTGTTATGGRPTTRYYVNPKIHRAPKR